MVLKASKSKSSICKFLFPIEDSEETQGSAGHHIAKAAEVASSGLSLSSTKAIVPLDVCAPPHPATHTLIVSFYLIWLQKFSSSNTVVKCASSWCLMKRLKFQPLTWLFKADQVLYIHHQLHYLILMAPSSVSVMCKMLGKGENTVWEAQAHSPGHGWSHCTINLHLH